MFDLKYHQTCQKIIAAYCEESSEVEYDKDSIYDWLHDKYCYDCKYHEDKDNDCVEYPLSCPQIRKHFEKEGAE